MNILHVRTLIAIHDTATFAQAAETLFLTPAAVSQQMRSLEDELQVELFDRSTRPPRLNAHGMSLVDDARDVLAQFDSLIEKARAPGEIAGTLRLGSASGIALSLIPRALAELRDLHPRLQVRIDEGLTDPLIGRVRRRELDAAIITEPDPPEPDMTTVPLMEEPLILVAPTTVRSTDWGDVVRSMPFLRLNPISGVGKIIDATLRRNHISVTEAMELDNSESIVELVKAGLGVGVVPENRLYRVKTTGIRTMPFGTPQAYRRVVLVERKRAQKNTLSDTLVELLVNLGSEATAPKT